MFSIFSEGAQSHAVKHLCCDVCHTKCTCTECNSGLQNSFMSHAEAELRALQSSHNSKQVKKQVNKLTDTDKNMLETDLLNYRMELIKLHEVDSMPLFSNIDLICGLSITTINRVVHDSEHITDADQVWRCYGLLEYSTAERIWELIMKHATKISDEKNEGNLIVDNNELSDLTSDTSSSESECDVANKVTSERVQQDDFLTSSSDEDY